MMKIEYRPIGVIRTPHQSTESAPIQPSRSEGARGTVELYEEFVDGLADLDGFSHVILLYHLHKVGAYRLRVKPFLDTRIRGLFATRAPWRPNPIGLSVVRLDGIEAHVLAVRDVDMLDGSPLLDIKPYVPDFDHRSGFRLGWLEVALKR
jgi:tRNA-Thr(GGU) m(6)t(6)A37 methyltransferase TsaA